MHFAETTPLSENVGKAEIPNGKVEQQLEESNNEELKIIQDNSAKAANDSNNEAVAEEGKKASTIADDKSKEEHEVSSRFPHTFLLFALEGNVSSFSWQIVSCKGWVKIHVFFFLRNYDEWMKEKSLEINDHGAIGKLNWY